MAAATICQVAHKGPDHFLSRPTPPSGSSAHLRQNAGPRHGTEATVTWLLPCVWAPCPHPVLPLCSSLTIQEASGPPDVPRTLCLGAFAFAVAAVSKALFAGSCTPQVRSLSARLCSNVPSVQTRGLPCPLPFTLTPLFFCTAMPICVPEAWRQPAGAWEVFTDYANSLLNISSAYVIPLRSIVLFSHLTGKPRHREAK